MQIYITIRGGRVLKDGNYLLRLARNVATRCRCRYHVIVLKRFVFKAYIMTLYCTLTLVESIQLSLFGRFIKNIGPAVIIPECSHFSRLWLLLLLDILSVKFERLLENRLWEDAYGGFVRGAVLKERCGVVRIRLIHIEIVGHTVDIIVVSTLHHSIVRFILMTGQV